MPNAVTPSPTTSAEPLVHCGSIWDAEYLDTNGKRTERMMTMQRTRLTMVLAFLIKCDCTDSAVHVVVHDNDLDRAVEGDLLACWRTSPNQLRKKIMK